MRTLPLALFACLLAAFPACAQPSIDPMGGCEPGGPGLPLVGLVTDAETGTPLEGAVVIVEDYPLGVADSVGCYSVIGADEIVGSRRRVVVDLHRYVPGDTLVDIVRGQSDTVHFALRRAAPGCCRLEGEWSLRLVLDTVPLDNLRPRAREVEGAIVFSERLPSGWEDEREDPYTEIGRFGLDLSTFFGGPFARDVSTTVSGPMTGDFLREAIGEVLAGDSVVMVIIPGMSHGGLSLGGTLRGDTVRGQWIQNAYCCGARGSFVMHRVPASPAGDSLVEQGIHAMDQARAAAAKEQEARSRREGHLRLRVWDTGAGRYVEVSFAAEGHEDNPGGGSSSLAYRSGADGWGPEHAFEPGRYDLLVYQFTCNGETRMANWIDPGPGTPRFTVTIESGKRVDHDIRLDVCAIPEGDGSDLDDEDAEVVAPAVPVP